MLRQVSVFDSGKHAFYGINKAAFREEVLVDEWYVRMQVVGNRFALSASGRNACWNAHLAGFNLETAFAQLPHEVNWIEPGPNRRLLEEECMEHVCRDWRPEQRCHACLVSEAQPIHNEAVRVRCRVSQFHSDRAGRFRNLVDVSCPSRQQTGRQALAPSQPNPNYRQPVIQFVVGKLATARLPDEFVEPVDVRGVPDARATLRFGLVNELRDPTDLALELIFPLSAHPRSRYTGTRRRQMRKAAWKNPLVADQMHRRLRRFVVEPARLQFRHPRNAEGRNVQQTDVTDPKK